MSAGAVFWRAAEYAAKYLGPPILVHLARVLENVAKSPTPLQTAELAARITDAETSTIDRLRLALRTTVGKAKP
jgi:hypothetical protein